MFDSNRLTQTLNEQTNWSNLLSNISLSMAVDGLGTVEGLCLDSFQKGYNFQGSVVFVQEQKMK